MDIFVKYPNEETLHHYRTGDGEESNDVAKFRATVLSGRADVELLDAEGNALDEGVQNAGEIEAAVQVDGGSGEQPTASEAEGNPAESGEGVRSEDPVVEEVAPQGDEAVAYG